MTQKHIKLAGTESRGYYANKLLSKIYVSNQTSAQPINLEIIQKAISQLQLHHNTAQQGTKHQAYNQPLAVAVMLIEYYPTTEALAATLLHKLVLAEGRQDDKIVHEFGQIIATKIKALHNLLTTKQVVDIKKQIKEIIEKGNKDVPLIGLLDNLYTMQNISTRPKWEQLEAALQTAKIFLPLAAYMNLPDIGNELAEICNSIILPPELSGEKSALSSYIAWGVLKFDS